MEIVQTAKDMEIYTHMLYLDVELEVILQRRLGDGEKLRPVISVEYLGRWQGKEGDILRWLWREQGISLWLLGWCGMLEDVVSLERDFRVRSEAYNLEVLTGKMDEALVATTAAGEGREGKVDTLVVLDAG